MIWRVFSEERKTMNKMLDFIKIDPAIEQKFVNGSYFNFVRSFVIGPNFIIAKDFAFRIKQLKQGIEELGGELRGVSFPTTWDEEILLFGKKRLKDAGVTIFFEDEDHKLRGDVVFKWKFVSIPSFINELLEFKRTKQYRGKVYAMMNNESWEAISFWTHSKECVFFEDDNRLRFVIYNPFEYYIDDHVCKTKLGIPVLFDRGITIGMLMNIYISVDNNLPYGKMVDVMDDLVGV